MAINPEDPEFQKSAKLASAYTNRAFVTVSGGMARIAFGESASSVGETVYHTAVSLTPGDLLNLADVIYSLIDEIYPPAKETPQPPNPFASHQGPSIGTPRKPIG